MTDNERIVTEDELHAYADGLLPEADAASIAAWLADHPDEARLVAEWQTQNIAIRKRFAAYEISRPADGLSVAARRPSASFGWQRLVGRLAASAALLAAGIAIGHFIPPFAARPPLQLTAMETLPRQAQSAFLVYASEVRHPVEVGADQEQHLATWLGKRLNIAGLKVPDLQMLGFRLVGGRLLPINDTPGAMFMYEDATGKRLTILVGRNKENQTTSFRFANEGAVDTFYWIDGDIGYAVTGEISRDLLQQVAEQCYKQFPA